MNKGFPVLIVEDNVTKRIELERALPLDIVFDVHHTPSIAQAYRALIRPWSLILLDMTFQVSQGSGGEIAKEALAGIELLQFMARRRIKAPVIVATQHSVFQTLETPGIDSIAKLDELLRGIFPGNYRTTIHVDLSEGAWKIQFREAVREALGL